MRSSELSQGRDLPKPPWFAVSSKTRVVLFVVSVGAFVFAVNLALDFVVWGAAHSPVTGYVISDGVAAVIAALFVLKIIGFANERREGVRRRLRMIEEMNHHVRNALEAIQMSAQLTRDRDAISIITDEVNRIEWALREVLGGPERPSPRA